MQSPELLAPAGNFEKLKTALRFGADAVYLAGTSFGMRSFAGNFTAEELPKAVEFAHSHGVRVHCTVNTMPRNDEVVHLPEQGIKGNSHFLFAEKNNVQLADLLSAWLKEKKLD